MRVPMAFALAVAALAAGPEQQAKKKKIVLPPDSLYLLKCKTLEDAPADLTENAGKVALIVNLASK